MTLQQSSAEFIADMQDGFGEIATHHFIKQEQANFINSLKTRLGPEKAIIVQVDFAQNYTCDIQDAVLTYH